jgi:hypothetical protein
MGLRSRNKGKRGEREAAAEIRRILRTEAHRGRQFCGSDESPDIVVDIPDLHFEVKRAETFRLYAALDQALADCGSRIPVVLHRANQRPWVAVIRLEDLPRLAATIHFACAAKQPNTEL